MPERKEESIINNEENIQRVVAAQILLTGVDANRSLLRPEVLGLCVGDNLVLSVDHFHTLEGTPIVTTSKSKVHNVVVKNQPITGVDCAVYTTEGKEVFEVAPYHEFRTEPLNFDQRLYVVSKDTFRTGQVHTCIYFDPTLIEEKILFDENPTYPNNQGMVVLFPELKMKAGDSGSIVLDKSGKIVGMLVNISLFPTQLGDFQFGHLIPGSILQSALSES